jgi:DNA uptake protein ComE-like DNA-binding protein
VSESYTWLKKTPSWVWWSFFPSLGGLALSYAGYKTKTSSWISLGIGITVAALILHATPVSTVIWIAQIAVAFNLKKEYLIKTSTKKISIPDRETAKLIAKHKGQLDINSCSKDEMVYTLNLPIVYANDIEFLRNEGYIFTDLDELSELAGIPENYVRSISPLITFHYDLKKEADVSWRRLNSLSFDELITCNLDIQVAQKIIEERQIKGPYRSLVDVRKRTGIPLSVYRHLL